MSENQEPSNQKSQQSLLSRRKFIKLIGLAAGSLSLSSLGMAKWFKVTNQNQQNKKVEDFKNQIGNEVKDHPMTQFKDLGSVTEQNYEKRLAQVFNTLSKNTIIPVDNNDPNKPSENEVKQWMVDNSGVMNGSMFIQDVGNGGEMKKAKMPDSTPSSAADIAVEKVSGTGSGSRIVSDTEPSNPSNGVEWTDTSYRQPAKKLYQDGKWRTISEGSNLPTTKVFSVSDDVEKSFDMSDVKETAEFALYGSPGKAGKTTGNLRYADFKDQSSGGGEGGRVVVDINLEYYDTLTIACPEKVGGSGGKVSASDTIQADAYGGDGGASIALYADGDLIVAVGGGGGGAAAFADGQGDNGDIGGAGGGNPAGGAGGNADARYDEIRSISGGSDGGVWTKDDSTFKSAVVIKEETTSAQEGGAQLFS